MKFSKIIILCFFLISIQYSHASDFWLQTKGPRGGNIISAAVTDDGILYCASEKNIKKSVDSGINWLTAMSGIYAERINFIYSPSGNQLYAGTSQGLFFSNNGSTNWQKLNSFDARSILVSDNLIIMGTDDGLYSAESNDAEWQLMKTAPKNRVFNRIYNPDNENLFVCSSQGLFSSDDFGKSWHKAYHIGSLNTKAFAIMPDGTYLAASEKGLFISQNQGTNWKNGHVDFAQISVHNLYINKYDIVFAFSENGLFRSTNSGISWSKIDEFDSAIPNLISEDKSGNIFVGTNHGLYISDPHTSPHKVSDGLDGICVNDLKCQTDGSILAAASEGIYRTYDAGESWTDIFSGFGHMNMNAVAAVDSLHIFAGSLSEGLFQTKDGGKTWSKSEIAAYKINDLYISSDFSVFAATDSSVFRSDNKGKGWYKTYTNPDIDPNITSLVISSDKQIYIGTQSSGVWRQQIKSKYPKKITIPGFDDKSPVSLVYTLPDGSLFVAGRHAVYFSSNQGQTWTTRNAGLQGVIVSMLAAKDGTLYAGTESKDVWISKDTGVSWSKMTSMLGKYVVQALDADFSGHLFAGTDNDGVWRSSESLNKDSLFIGVFKSSLMACRPNSTSEFKLYCRDQKEQIVDDIKFTVQAKTILNRDTSFTLEKSGDLFFFQIPGTVKDGLHNLTFFAEKYGYTASESVSRQITVKTDNSLELKVVQNASELIPQNERLNYSFEVYDKDNNPVPGAILHIKNIALNENISATFNQQGKVLYSIFNHPDLIPGKYEAEFYASYPEYGDSKRIKTQFELSELYKLYIKTIELSTPVYHRADTLKLVVMTRDNKLNNIPNVTLKMTGAHNENFVSNSEGIINYEYIIPENASGKYKLYLSASLAGEYLDSDLAEFAYEVKLPDGIDDDHYSEIITVSPNPADDILNINVHSFDNSTITIEICDIFGRKIIRSEKMLYSGSINCIRTDISSLTTGIYFVNILSGKSSGILKFIKR